MSLWGGKDKAAKAAPKRGRHTAEIEKTGRPNLKEVSEPMLIGLGYIVATLALVAAIAMTGVAIVTIWRPALIEAGFLTHDYRSNIVVGAVYFWIEVAVILLGVRLIDSGADMDQRKKSVVAVFNRMSKIEEELYDLRYTFAENLDQHADGNGAYEGANFHIINNGLDAMRSDVIAFFFKRKSFSVVEAKLFDRVLRQFDICVMQSLQFGLDAERANARVIEISAREGAQPDDARQEREQLENLLGQLKDEAHPYRNGMNGLVNALSRILWRQNDRRFR